MERTIELTKDDANAMELKLCRGQNVVQGLARGQDSPICEQLTNAQPDRKPVTTPPANNRGKSASSAVRH
jgi:hypothetical protein